MFSKIFLITSLLCTVAVQVNAAVLFENKDLYFEAASLPIKVAHKAPNKVFYGRIEGRESFDIASFSVARVAQLHVSAGQQVAKNDVLVTLYSPELKAQLDAAKAKLKREKIRLQNAQEEQQRTNRLVALGLQSEADLDRLVAAKEVALQSVNLAQAQLTEIANLQIDHQIRAQSAGVISDIYTRLGDFVKVGESILRFQTSDAYRVAFKLPEQEALKLSRDSLVNLAVPSLDLQLQGSVVERTLPSNSHSPWFTVTIELDSASQSFTSEQHFGRSVQLLLPVSDDILYEVSAYALRYDPFNRPYLLLDEAVPRKVLVKPVATVGDTFLISANEYLGGHAMIVSEAKLALNLASEK
ncbi:MULTISPECIES: efflux RND transporter periplasmic adaptor subunit [Pseudoalteromonas]|uniref:Uncharacterized protein n=1 Tax=Pseudoalteromonas amylolytica TaxID=1859457 RepID=A0A1S1MX76_9GAMM|nr:MULTISPECIES: efflux RND transporter periplasmic adaptor subunit [Pseudoalteromonas]OHU85031.1 hypothetical protein BFC16_20315 [Pseudoalteromonas sp. JW3]OHU90017.1 hypothetical protein BET10_14660 [Pseudoalteromonas amylolytica]